MLSALSRSDGKNLILKEAEKVNQSHFLFVDRFRILIKTLEGRMLQEIAEKAEIPKAEKRIFPGR